MNSKGVLRGWSRKICLSRTVQERKLLRSRLDSIGTLAANSFPKVTLKYTLNAPEKKKKLNEYSPVRQAFYARGEDFIIALQITGEPVLKHVHFFFDKKSSSFVAVSQRWITHSLISPRGENGSRLIQARLRASSGGLLQESGIKHNTLLGSISSFRSNDHDLTSFSFEWVFRIQPITNVENREPTSLFIIQEGGVLKNRTENRMNFNSKSQNNWIL